MTASHGPYSPVRQAGDMYFVSGQIGVDPVTKQSAADIAAQTETTLDNLQAALAEHNLDLRHVVKTTIFLVDMADFDAVNHIYQDRMPEPRPARSCVQVAGLPRVTDTELLVEIEGVAYAESAGQQTGAAA